MTLIHRIPGTSIPVNIRDPKVERCACDKTFERIEGYESDTFRIWADIHDAHEVTP